MKCNSRRRKRKREEQTVEDEEEEEKVCTKKGMMTPKTRTVLVFLFGLLSRELLRLCCFGCCLVAQTHARVAQGRATAVVGIVFRCCSVLLFNLY
jgi:hypothetical protein